MRRRGDASLRSRRHRGPAVAVQVHREIGLVIRIETGGIMTVVTDGGTMIADMTTNDVTRTETVEAVAR